MRSLHDRARVQAVPEAEPPSHADVLRGAIAGERWAHAALYDVLYPVVARALQKIIYRAADYEDLVQTSFERIVRTLRDPRATEIESLAAWSSAIATRVALDALRARVRERGLFTREPANMRAVLDVVGGTSLERELDARDQLAWLQGAFAAMNADQAEAVLLHDVIGHDLAEIARLTEVTLTAAQKRLSRGHIELKRQWRAKVGSR